MAARLPGDLADVAGITISVAVDTNDVNTFEGIAYANGGRWLDDSGKKVMINDAGFIDACLSFDSTNRPLSATEVEIDSASARGGVDFFGVPGVGRDRARTGPGYEVAQVMPEARVARNFAPERKSLESARELGFTAGNVIPEKGIVRGTSAFVALSEVGPNEAIIKPDTFQHVAFDIGGGRAEAYPSQAAR